MGITTTLTAAKAIPTDECSGSPPATRVRTDCIVTKTARAKNATATVRNATFSRVSGSGAANCHAIAAADNTSIQLSRPNDTRAVDDATVPALMATTASTTL